jgi:hypothetical protein
MPFPSGGGCFRQFLVPETGRPHPANAVRQYAPAGFDIGFPARRVM